MSRHFDVAIAGGGPGGCSAAITAARSGMRVLLLDSSAFPRHKVCGEFCSSESLRLLAALLTDGAPNAIAASVELDTAEFFRDGASFCLRLSPSARSLTRYDMDAALWAASESAGVTALQRTSVTGVNSNGRVAVETSGGTFTADAFINASGRWSTVRRLAVSGPRWLGIKAHFLEKESPPGVQLYFFDGGYCGVQPVSPGRINVCAMVRPEVARRLGQVFALEPRLLDRSRGWRPAIQELATSPVMFRRPDPVSGNLLHVGDAAAFIDPFVGDGISMALQSGKLAADSVREGLNGGGRAAAAERYRREYKRLLAPAFRNSASLRSLLTAPRIIRKAAILAMKCPAVSRSLVRLTRAGTND